MTVSWFTWKHAQLPPLTWSSCGSVCAQKGAMVHLIFPSGSISMSHQERTTWARPDARGSNCLIWQADELLTCLLKSTLWNNIQELKHIWKSHTSFLKLSGWPHQQWDLFAMDFCLQRQVTSARLLSTQKELPKTPTLLNVSKHHYHPGYSVVPEHGQHVAEDSEVSGWHLVQLNVTDGGCARAPLHFWWGNDDPLSKSGLNTNGKQLVPWPHPSGLHQLSIDVCSVRHCLAIFLSLY